MLKRLVRKLTAMASSGSAAIFVASHMCVVPASHILRNHREATPLLPPAHTESRGNIPLGSSNQIRAHHRNNLSVFERSREFLRSLVRQGGWNSVRRNQHWRLTRKKDQVELTATHPAQTHPSAHLSLSGFRFFPFPSLFLPKVWRAEIWFETAYYNTLEQFTPCMKCTLVSTAWRTALNRRIRGPIKSIIYNELKSLLHGVATLCRLYSVCMSHISVHFHIAQDINIAIVFSEH